MAIFPNIPPSKSSKMQASQPVKSHRFGDGHIRYLKIGVRGADREWSLRWAALTKAEANQIDTFLSGQAAGQIFDWTPPGHTRSQKFICTRWTFTPLASGHADIDAVFTEHYA